MKTASISAIAGVMAATGALGTLAPAQTPALTCTVATPPTRTLTFAPRLGLTPRKIDSRGNLQLTGCTSPDGSASYLRSGWMAVRATSDSSCASARHVRGRAVVTWFDATSRPVGRSVLRIRGDRLATQSPADALLDGTITAGPLSGRRARGGITPVMGILRCATQGMSTLSGTGTITFT
ncbi:hypothetical protein HII36_33845 [Nonomuraea sp. NN258]|uniref:hypothetical protein n=1 Tax=Nonomuraea antri TaxID=2730852 RepID=UPI0015698A11|nr:hypothetical protein [Nonomuraea antri]NRQ36784.1 hypothetical protein [Nonomuraea antri]